MEKNKPAHSDKTQRNPELQKTAEEKAELSARTQAQKKTLRRQQALLCENLSFAAAEAYKLLRANLQFTMPEGESHILGVTSANRGEGKSTTSINLAYSFAQSGKRVLLIDGDMRLPSVAGRLDVDQAPGLSNLLAGMCEDREALRPSGKLVNWYILPAGDIPPNPSELLGSEKMHELLDRMTEHFDLIVVDLPPIGIVSDALVLSPWTDGLIAVVRQNYTDRRSLDDCMYQIEKFNVKFLGFVMTDAKVGETGYKRYGKYGKYGRYGRYGRYGSNYGYSSYGYGQNSYGYNYNYNYSYGYGSDRRSAKSDKAFKEAVTGDNKAPFENE